MPQLRAGPNHQDPNVTQLTYDTQDWQQRCKDLKWDSRCAVVVKNSSSRAQLSQGSEMITICIEGGPSWEELTNRMLSGRPVTFLTTEGPLQVLIEEMRETHATGDRVSFSGRVICKRTEAHACGDYNALFKTGRLCAAVFSQTD